MERRNGAGSEEMMHRAKDGAMRCIHVRVYALFHTQAVD